MWATSRVRYWNTLHMAQCLGTTRQGRPCRNPAGPDGFCHLHGGSSRSFPGMRRDVRAAPSPSPLRPRGGAPRPRDPSSRSRGWWWRLRWTITSWMERFVLRR
ncbi:DUF5763 domain-containing protein [Streptomyces sp. AA1529]|uniref:DUF5763 domain-containing protein n=1 Tax=Streptomyces sp. AA1529 TaxID=1203257 RepID=UPI003D716B26